MWTITQSESGYYVIHDDDGQYLVAFQNEGIARHVVACVNACASLTTAQLEAAGEGVVLGMVEALRATKKLDNMRRDGMNANSSAYLTAYWNAMDKRVDVLMPFEEASDEVQSHSY